VLWRRPDFIVIGAMKSGTTTLYRWLESHPGTALPELKEPDFFCFDHNYRRGLEHYATHFAGAPVDKVTGEASVKYMAPRMADAAAARIALHTPDTLLVALLRDPVERLRSEYRYNRQRGWTTTDLTTAVMTPENPYVGKSLYFRCLLPYFERFDRSQLLVVRTEDLRDDGSAWPALLDFLGLERVPLPMRRHLATDELPQMRPINALLEKRHARMVISRMPRPVRRTAQWLVTDRDPSAAARRRADSEVPLPASVVDLLRKDASLLADALGWSTVPWPSVR
jgi:hypothetical protein